MIKRPFTKLVKCTCGALVALAEFGAMPKHHPSCPAADDPCAAVAMLPENADGHEDDRGVRLFTKAQLTTIPSTTTAPSGAGYHFSPSVADRSAAYTMDLQGSNRVRAVTSAAPDPVALAQPQANYFCPLLDACPIFFRCVSSRNAIGGRPGRSNWLRGDDTDIRKHGAPDQGRTSPSQVHPCLSSRFEQSGRLRPVVALGFSLRAVVTPRYSQRCSTVFEMC